MFKSLTKTTILFLFSLFTLSFSATSFTIGIKSSDDTKSQKDYATFIQLLSEKANAQITLKTFKSIDELSNALISGEVEFTIVSPTDYLKLHESAKINAIATKKNKGGTAYCQGTIIAGKDKGINTIVDLKGKSICYGPKGSFNKYYAALSAYKSNGFKEEDVKAEFGSSCGNIAGHIIDGKTDAGVICDYSWDAWVKKDNKEYTGKLIVVGKGPKLRDDAIAASPKVDTKKHEILVSALIALEGNEEIVKPPLKAKGFEKSTDKDYDELRNLLNNL